MALVMRLTHQAQSPQIILCPLGLRLDNGFQCAHAESVCGMMEGKRNAASVRVLVLAVASFLPSQYKAVGLKGGNNLPGCQGTEFGVAHHPTLTATTG